MAPRVSNRASVPLRTSSSSDSCGSKTRDHRSSGSVHSEPLNRRKLGTRIAGLETQLEQAQGELKLLKDQLGSAETSKKEAQKTIKLPAVSNKNQNLKEINEDQETPDEIQKETDVFEVPIEMVKVKISPESSRNYEFEEEISSLKVKIDEKEKKLEALEQENQVLKRQLSEAKLGISSAIVKEQKLNMKMTQMEEELRKSKTDKNQLEKKLKEMEGETEALEVEMKKMRVQTEQWRKAADAAAAILAGGGGAVEKQYGGVFEGFVLEDDELDDGFGNENGKKKGSGIRVFGDLWKKKGHK